MIGGKSNPPKLALWWLQHACPGSDTGALAGDLIERFHEGQSRAWFWKQVFIAFAVGVAGEIRRHWPHFGYAIAGSGAMVATGLTAIPAQRAAIGLSWSTLPWPLSQLVFELGVTFLLALAALAVLAAGLAAVREFRWASLLRTAVITLTLLTFGHYSPDFLPWLTRPAPGDPHGKILVVSGGIQVALLFSAFLAAAWLGCQDRVHKRPKNIPSTKSI